MNSIITIPKSGWSSIETIALYDYGELQGRINPFIGLAFIRWYGNNLTPDTTSLSIILPNKYKPLAHVIVHSITSNLLDRTNLGSIEIRTDGKCNIFLPTPLVTWTGGQATYPIA